MINLKVEITPTSTIEIEFLSEPATGDLITIDNQHFFIHGRRWEQTENKLWKPIIILHDPELKQP